MKCPHGQLRGGVVAVTLLLLFSYVLLLPVPGTRALALQGAEIILMPIWDSTAPLVLARAMENRVCIVTPSYSYGNPSVILDPNGAQVAFATEEGAAAIATIDLNRRYEPSPYLGIIRERIVRELHAEIPVKRPGFVQ